MFRRLALSVISVLLLIACGSAFHYWNEVRKARADTIALVQQAFQTYGRQVTIKDMPPLQIDMLLKIEDPMFREHQGVDLTTPGAGMTTITQGLAKLLYFPEGFRQGIGKIRQTLIAEYALDDLVSKDEQLELYLNATYFGLNAGKPIHGIAAAADFYFRKSYRDLSDDEFIALIGMTISPETHKPGTSFSAIRVARIKTFLSGKVKPVSILDFEYVGKQSGTWAEEALMSFLRLITHANPTTIVRARRAQSIVRQ
jgi:membrane carboxypeptidase/penicillin-binding protein PbpC